MKSTTAYELAEAEQELIRVRCQRTDRVVWINPKDWQSDGGGSLIWGQVSQTNESGWYFDISDLEEL
jgi:hypothetical protein